MSPKRRKDRSEDVLELRDLDSQRIRAFLLGTAALVVLIYAMAQLLETLTTSLDQQEELTERFEKSRRQLAELRDAKSSASEPPRT